MSEDARRRGAGASWRNRASGPPQDGTGTDPRRDRRGNQGVWYIQLRNMVLAVLAMSAITYHLIERPFLALRGGYLS